MNRTRRIVSLISSATEMLYLLGLGDLVVGVSHECDFPPDVANKPRLTRSNVDASQPSAAIDRQVQDLSAQQASLYQIDVDRLAVLAPDLIITQAQCDVCAVRYADVISAVDRRPELRNATVLPLNPYRIADVFADIQQIADAAGVADRGRRVVAELSARVERISQQTAALSPDELPRVACFEWIDPPMLAANWTPQLVAWAGGQDGMPTDGRHSSYADWNKIVRFDPQVVVIMPCGFALERAISEAQVLASRPEWPTLSAVREGRVYAVDGNALFNRSGPRLVDSLELLAHLLHPERFAPPAHVPPDAWRRLRTEANHLIAATA
jgi:iron complex transport system substrate-binding protein